MSELPLQGQRIALRYRDPSGPRELIGHVTALGSDGLGVLDRRLAPHLLPWDQLVSWRAVPQVPRGRDPLAADGALLDRMAGDPRLDLPGALPIDSDIRAVARLCDLLGPGIPDQAPEAYDRGGFAASRYGPHDARAIVVGEWATIRLTTDDPFLLVELALPLARWAAYRDARSLQVRGLAATPAGFTDLRRT